MPPIRRANPLHLVAADAVMIAFAPAFAPAVALALALACAAAGAEGRNLGAFKGWTAMSFDDTGQRACMAFSQPVESAGEYTKRGEVFVFVTHRPDEKRRDKVSFEAGYPFEPSSEVQVSIGGAAFTLFTDGSTAWTYGEDDDRAMVSAMRAGREMVVEGRSERGTLTRDTYSLYGFSAAHAANDAACKAR